MTNTVSLRQTTVSTHFIQEKAHKAHIIKIARDEFNDIMKSLNLRSLTSRKQREKISQFLISNLGLQGYIRRDLTCQVYSEVNPVVFHLTLDLMTEDERKNWKEQQAEALRERIRKEVTVEVSGDCSHMIYCPSDLFQLIAKHVNMVAIKPYSEDKAKFANFVFKALELNIIVCFKSDICLNRTSSYEMLDVKHVATADDWLSKSYGRID